MRPLNHGHAGQSGHSGHSNMDDLGEHIVALIGVTALTVALQVLEWWSAM